ncbi:MAG: acyclic terpene utilization AtuA family protein [Pseudomonadota bacterium]
MTPPPRRAHIGCGAGFSGDRTDAPISVVRHLKDLPAPRFLILETLGERTLADAQKARLADPQAGFEPLLGELLTPVLADCLAHKIRIVSNCGAANPLGAARFIKGLAAELGLPAPKIGVVLGDDLTGKLGAFALTPWEGERADLVIDETAVVAANAYLGADAIRAALDEGADIVVAGRVSDPALAVGPLTHVFGWGGDAPDRIAAGILAGHLLECGSQITGGYFADPGMKDVPGMDDIGYPIAEVTDEGVITVFKAPGTGGAVTSRTVKEQLLYEIHDPAAYITPDGILDLTEVEVEETGPDRVRVTGARGRPATDTYKVTVSLRGGWLGEGEISYAGPNAEARARLTGETLRKRLARRGLDVRARIDLIGVESIFDSDDGALARSRIGTAQDVRVRLAVEADEKATVEAATQEVLALLCSGPAGGGGARRRHVARIHTVSCLVAKAAIDVRVEWI